MSKTKSETRRLPVELTTAEVRERSLELAAKCVERAQLEARKKAAAAEFKATDHEINARGSELAEMVKTSREYREVECIWQRSESALEMILVRQDTGEVVESRAMTQEERQPNLLAFIGGKTKEDPGQA